MDLFKFFSSKTSSKEVAKDRLQLILIHDRANNVSEEFLEMIKGEILKVISNYAEIDNEDIDIRFTRTEEENGSAPALVASIPIKNMKRKI